MCIPLVFAECSEKWTNGNIYTVENDPINPTEVTFDSQVHICTITNYHWNYGMGTEKTGKISLVNTDDGTTYGPWKTTGKPGQGGVKNAYWFATVNEDISQGMYQVKDSDESTWANNEDSDFCGMTEIHYDISKSSKKTVGCSWTGSWPGAPQFFGGAISLTQSGNSVKGTYPLNDGKITGTISGNIMSGTWKEGAKSGPIEFTLLSDCKSIKGRVSGSSGGEMTYHFELEKS
ncbi:hypothetical protein KSK55_12975 [Methanospirillum purgamenti]|uniref:Uncharacterized protein n=1 Tax=Methanospirillum hungatei TaxID=2203 RepID=A0A8F5VJZ9_METHU|nr:hypothetical protein [Methanospirillum hungatei]QXO94234.1 hypothetical protein KSK55_12975 [Methanospirillum hungatei]